MGFKTKWIGQFNPFLFIHCPTCGGSDFTSLSGSGVWCAQCNTGFSVRYTAGDPGCVVDSSTECAWGPIYLCPQCGAKEPSYAASMTCSSCKCAMDKHPLDYGMEFGKKRLSRHYQIMKLGDYCSGWIASSLSVESSATYSHPSCHDETLQTRWDEFQQREDFKIAEDGKEASEEVVTAEIGEAPHEKLKEEYGLWGEHPDCPRADWALEATNGDTVLGYWEWVAAKLETEAQ